MRTLKFIILVPVLATLCGCMNTSKVPLPEPPAAIEQKVDARIPVAVVLDADSTAVITGSIDGVKDSRTYTIEANMGQKLSLRLVTGKKMANLRVHQIISPSGVADGPFGTELEFDLTETGLWSIVLGESNMVGDDYKGGYMLTVVLSSR